MGIDKKKMSGSNKITTPEGIKRTERQHIYIHIQYIWIKRAEGGGTDVMNGDDND